MEEVDSNKHMYKGYKLNDRWNGYGKVVYKFGHIYEGELLNGKRHGKGKFVYQDGTEYFGQ